MNVTRVSPLYTVNLNTFVNPGSIGANLVKSAQSTSSRIRVLGIAMVSTLANNVKFQSATNDITATFPLGANGGLVLPFNEHGWFQTNFGEDLNVNLSVGTPTAIQIQYIIVFGNSQ
jgi:hypothetical protein